MRRLYFPLPLRLALLFTLILGLALWFFGNSVYSQAVQNQYSYLDDTLSSRAASVRLGKMMACSPASGAAPSTPYLLPSVDGLGGGGVAIEILDSHLNLLASTSNNTNDPMTPGVDGLTPAPVPFDAQAINKLLQENHGAINPPDSPFATYSTITYQNQHIRVYTLLSNCAGTIHFIQTARSEQDIEQSLNDLRLALSRGAVLVMTLTLIGVWLISWGVLATVRRITRTAQSISDSRDFSKRVASKALPGRDEFAELAATFNQMLASLEEAYQRQQRFVADASHELRAPITSIRCNLDLLAKAPDLPAAEAQAALADARAEAERMGRLVNDLLLLAHADNTQHGSDSTITDPYDYKKSMRPLQQVDLDSLLLDVFRQYRPLETREQDGLGPQLTLQHTTPVKVYGSADQLKQALVALVDNALKYTPREGYVTLSLDVADNFAIVQVSDTGIGIFPDDLPHIFERFYRADRARTRDRGGSGLGLAIVKSIIEAHHGSITVESTPGKGSIFTLRVPVASSFPAAPR
jgi:two-component system OmpR family sensor kinase